MKILFLLFYFFRSSASDFMLDDQARLPESSFLHLEEPVLNRSFFDNDELFSITEAAGCNEMTLSSLLSRSTDASFVSDPYCKFCDKTYKRDFMVLRHIVSRHSHEKGFEQEFLALGGQFEKIYHCDKCSFKTLDKNYYAAHMARHNEQKLYQCDVCQMGFNLINDLKRHKFNIHNDVLDLKLYSCNECPASFIKKATLLNHIANHLESKKSINVVCGGVTKKPKNVPKVELQSPIDQMQDSLITESPKIDLNPAVLSILVNLKKENPVKIKPKKKEKKIYKCHECGLTCNSKINHKIHMARHQKKPLYFCDFCSWGCYLKNDLNRHIISKHVDHAGEVFGHSCKSCNAIFPRKNQLVNHEKKHQISLSGSSSKAVGP